MSPSGKEPHGGRLGSTSIICDQETKVRLCNRFITIVSRANSNKGLKERNLGGGPQNYEEENKSEKVFWFLSATSTLFVNLATKCALISYLFIDL